MAEMKVGEQCFALEPDESVLDCLLRNAQDVAWSCRSGVCQSCLVKSVKGTPSGKAQAGLKATLQAAGYALACQWKPEDDVELSLPGAEEGTVPATLAAKDFLNPDVLRLLVDFDAQGTGFTARPGQYLNLVNDEGVSRSYSIANDPEADGHVELHVARTEKGLMTNWLFDSAEPGLTLHLRGPAGSCFYVPDEARAFPMLLAGTGTGLAPLYGIVNDALERGHRGPIMLLHGGAVPERFYYMEELIALQRRHGNFCYRALVKQGSGNGAAWIEEADIYEQTLFSLDTARLKETRVYLCGAPSFVNKLRKQVFLKGVASGNIFCDAFVTRSFTG